MFRENNFTAPKMCEVFEYSNEFRFRPVVLKINKQNFEKLSPAFSSLAFIAVAFGTIGRNILNLEYLQINVLKL
jgi:hypothetical protein